MSTKRLLFVAVETLGYLFYEALRPAEPNEFCKQTKGNFSTCDAFRRLGAVSGKKVDLISFFMPAPTNKQSHRVLSNYAAASFITVEPKVCFRVHQVVIKMRGWIYGLVDEVSSCQIIASFKLSRPINVSFFFNETSRV